MSVAIIEAILVLAVVTVLAIGAALATGIAPGADDALAAKNGGRGTTSSVTVRVADGAFGTMTIGSVSGGSVAWVHVWCRVADGSTGLDSWRRPAADGTFAVQLGPTPTWTSGGANCTAAAGSFSRNGRFLVAASTTFVVF